VITTPSDATPSDAAPADPAEALRRARAGLLQQPGLAGASLRAALSDSYDRWLSRLVPDAGVALAAVGGLGRREPAPYSDLDLVLLHRRRGGEVAALADAIWYPVWDSGVGLDHSMRTPEQALAAADADLRAMLGLLELRHIAGDAALTEATRESVRGRWRAVARGRVPVLRELAADRAARSGDGAFLLEPNLKESRGGLRDAHALRALALAQLVDFPAPSRVAYELLLDVRGELHRQCARAEDVLRLQDQAAVAVSLGIDRTGGSRPDEQLLRRVNLAARTVGHALDAALRRCAPMPRRRVGRFGGSAERVGLARDVIAHDAEVVLAREADPGSDPGLVVRAARAAAESGLPLSQFALDRLAASAASPPQPWPAALREDFLALLGRGRAAVPVLESLDLAGLLTPLLPEWDTVRGTAQHDPVHQFTVDRHLLETAARAAEHGSGSSRPDLLLLGALLHDIGKGSPGDHSVVGAPIAAGIARRIGLPEPDVATVEALTRHHLLLPVTATRRDLDDPVTIRTVAEAVGNSAELLELLHDLALADAAATGPAAWSEWKAGLVAELVRRVRELLGGAQPPSVPALEDELRALAEAGRLAVLIRGEQIVVAAPDTVGVLYRTAGVLALQSLDVRSASIRTHAGTAVNSFVVSPRFGRMPPPELLRAELARVLAGDTGLAQRLRDKERAYARTSGPSRPASVHWFDDEASGATVLEYRGSDAIGLLCRVAAALERCQLDVRSARVSSMAGSVVDAFYVTTRSGHPVPFDRRADIETELRLA
jgi:[protein-PII] uridylyltransferase